MFDADTFDDIFAELVEVNDEGTVVQVGSHQPTAHVPFTAKVIRELEARADLRRKRPFSLWTAWSHREHLLFRWS